MPKRTFQPNRRRRSKTHGFRTRMKTKSGRAVLSRRRAKGRKRVSVKPRFREELSQNHLQVRSSDREEHSENTAGKVSQKFTPVETCGFSGRISERQEAVFGEHGCVFPRARRSGWAANRLCRG